VRTVGFAVPFRSCRAIQGGFLLMAMLCSYHVSDTWPEQSIANNRNPPCIALQLLKETANPTVLT